MRFRWRRHTAVTVAPVVHEPRLTDEQVLQIVEDRLSDHFGPRGSWSVVPRDASDTDVLFQEFLTRSIATELTTALREGAAVPIEDTATPVSPEWKPEPITVWADSEEQLFRPDPADLTALVDAMTLRIPAKDVPAEASRRVA